MRNLPPYPTGDLHNWAQQLVSYLQNRGEVDTEVLPQAVLLAHQIDNDRAGTDGILMFDPVSSAVVVSENGVWVPIIAGYGDLPVLADYGDGTATQANIDAMEADVGYIRINRPQPITSNLRINTPLYVMAGAYFTVASGNILYMSGPINAGLEWIFRGDGEYDVGRDGGGTERGEEARVVKAEWFGAYTFTGIVDPEIDMAPYFNKANDALDNTREGIIECQNGNYHVYSTITLNRGVWLKGVGSRRTVMRVHGDGYPNITTAETACRVTGMNFEQFPNGTQRTSPHIELNHTECVVEDVRANDCDTIVVVNGTGCIVRDIRGVYGTTYQSGRANSCLVSVRQARCMIEFVHTQSSIDYWPEALVNVGKFATVTVGDTTIRELQSQNGAISVKVVAEGGDIRNVLVSNVQSSGQNTVDPETLVDIETSNDFEATGIVVDGYTTSGVIPSIMRINNGGGACKVERVIVNNGTGGSQTTGTFFDITSLGGVVKDCAVGAGVIPDDMLDFFRTSGTGIETGTLRTPFQDYVRAGYGGIRLAVPIALADLTTTAWRIMEADSASLAESKGVTQRFDANCLNLNVVGIWQLNASFSISHDEAQSGRTFKVRVYNATGAIASPSTVVGIGRNTDATTFSFSALFEVTSANVTNRIRVEIGEASVTVGSVFVNSFSYSANFVSEYSR